VAKQTVALKGKKLYYPKDYPEKGDKLAGTVLEQITPLEACDQHGDCPGPIVNFEWEHGKVRRECMYMLIRGKKFQLRDA